MIFNREGLHELPYSVDEIYEIKTSGKYHTFTKMFPSAKGHLYSSKSSRKKFSYQILLTEDSKSGFQFFENYLKDKSVRCESSESNGAVFNWLKAHPNDTVLVIADGAAFGSEIDRALKIQEARPEKIRICLPESFEWLILKSGIIHDHSISIVLDHPSDHADSTEYFSWENFFEQFLVSKTADTPFQYQKSRINAVYLTNENSNKIIEEIKPAIDT